MSEPDLSHMGFRVPLCVIGEATGVAREAKLCGDGDEANWPTRTSLACWHCCHPFDTPPVPLPVRYDPRRDVFHVQGCFCSFACCKAFVLSSSTCDVNRASTNLTMLYRWAMGKTGHVTPAPPRCTLRMFGGELDIDEFRRLGSGEGACVRGFPPNMILSSPNVMRLETSSTTNTAREVVRAVNFDNASDTNDPLRLKRDKPLKGSKNSLERLMNKQTKAKASK